MAMHAKGRLSGVVAVLAACGLLAALRPLPATADVIEEIVVTATKRGAENVQDIAGAIHALGGAGLEEKSIVDFEGFAGAVPGLQFQDLGPGDKEYIIRGINGNGPAVVGAYFDEYVITANDQQDGGGKNAPIKLVDMERIEVLNGPQGTLYGANSMAGNIKYIPRKPDASRFGGFVDSEFSGTEHGGSNYAFSGAINLPVVEDLLGARLVFWYTGNEGWIDQPRLQNSPFDDVGSFTGNEKNINDEDTKGARVMFRWTPTDRLTADLLYLKQDLETDGSSRFTAPGTPAWPLSLTPELRAAIEATRADNIPANPDTGAEEMDVLGNDVRFPASVPGLPALTPDGDYINVDVTRNPRSDNVDLLGGTLRYDFGFGAATVSASYYDHDLRYHFDSTPVLNYFDVSTPGITAQPQSYETKMVEARFASALDGPVNFVAGVYYQKDNNDFASLVSTLDGDGNPADGRYFNPANANEALFAGGTAFFARDRFDEIEQKALFGEVTYDFLGRARLLLGARAFEVDLKSTQSTLLAFTGAVSMVAGEVIGKNLNGNDIGLIETDGDTIRPKASLSYHVNDEAMVYVLYSEGFRVGGVNNGNQPFAMGIPETYDSDELSNLEFGLKSRWLDNTLQFNATLFLIDWDDIQVEPRDPVGNIPFTTNGGEAGVGGVEWAAQYLPLENLQLDFVGAWFFKHELTEDQPPRPGTSDFVIIGKKGDDIPNVPEFQLHAAAKYETRLFGKRVSVAGDLTYRDKTNTEFRADSLFNIKLDSFIIANLYASLQLSDSVDLGVYVKNVGNEPAIYDGIAAFQDPKSVVAARPRTFGATMRWSY